MADETQRFRQKLEALLKKGQAEGKRLSTGEIRQSLKDEGLDEEKMQAVFRYLSLSLDLYDEDLGIESGRETEDQGLVKSLRLYLEELNQIAPLPEKEEFTLFQKSAAGDAAARNRLAECYLPAVSDLAAEMEKTLQEEDRITTEDLVGEANLGLFQALHKLKKEDSLSAFRAFLLNAVTEHLEAAVQEALSLSRSDEKVLTRLNRLASAAHDLEEELDRKPSLEELSAQLELPMEEIQDLLRVGGEKLSVEDLSQFGSYPEA